MNVTGGEVWEMAQLGGEGFLGLEEVVRVGESDGFPQGFSLEVPQLEGVVHAARNDSLAGSVEVGRQNLVPEMVEWQNQVREEKVPDANSYFNILTAGGVVVVIKDVAMFSCLLEERFMKTRIKTLLFDFEHFKILGN